MLHHGRFDPSVQRLGKPFRAGGGAARRAGFAVGARRDKGLIPEMPMAMAKRLLIVDDDAHICDFARKVAEGAGFEVVTASTHEDFLDAYDRLDPTVILLDLVMPQVDGIGVLQILADRQSRARVLIMSGYHPELLRSGSRLGQGYDLEMRGTLHKPFGVADPRDALNAVANEEEA